MLLKSANKNMKNKQRPVVPTCYPRLEDTGVQAYSGLLNNVLSQSTKINQIKKLPLQYFSGPPPINLWSIVLTEKKKKFVSL